MSHSTKNKTLFISYAHEDQRWAHALHDHLDEMINLELCNWIDYEALLPGDNFDRQIKKGIGIAKWILLMISPDYIRSNYINGKELKWIKQKVRTADKKSCTRLLYITISDDADDHGVSLFLAHNQLDSLLAMISLDSPLKPNPSQDEINQQIPMIARSIQRAIDPDFDRLQRSLGSEYTLQGCVNEGGSALIYRATRESFDNDFAIKVLKNNSDLRWFRSTLRKASVVTSTSNVIPISGHHIRSSLSYCILRYIEGCNLSRHIDHNRPLSVDFITNVIYRIGQALLKIREEKAYRKLVFKILPENILIDRESGEPYLSLAVRIDRRRGISYLERLLRRSDTSDEEWQYVVPELIIPQSSEPEVGKIDQYLLGLTAYQMLTGTVPQTHQLSKSRNATQPRCDDSMFDPLKKLNFWVCAGQPREFDHRIPIFSRMAQADPEHRYPTLQDALDALKNPCRNSLQIVVRSYHRCLTTKCRTDDFMTTFYKALFRKNTHNKSSVNVSEKFMSALKRVFSESGLVHTASKIDPARKDPRWSNQKTMVKHAILSLITYYDHFLQGYAGEPTILSLYRRKHVEIFRQEDFGDDLVKNFYTAFLNALLYAVRKHDREWLEFHRNLSLDQVWATVIQPGLDYMSEMK